MIAWILLAACSLSRAPQDTEAHAACGRVYGSLVDSLARMHEAGGLPPPVVVPKAVWVPRCVDLGLEPAQLRCADPKLQQADPACEAHLEPVRDRVQHLQEQLVTNKEQP